MSAPETNVEKQRRRHAGPIIGITAGLIFVAIILVAYLFFIASPDDEIVEGTQAEDPVVVAPAAD
ncbi:hypothetical protein MWU52_05430 [Jannaschia sp. S6380]|uniref:hypothetical protein n=1 Tax=Jannaschia sp. S6380 TaxID=2926408 RepID=UPI001FF630A3|nr:hypothetical protein [Jannaschia sp. S6380]MCK0166987.1 hypothetical protein [Jannaschia sp. S6380]